MRFEITCGEDGRPCESVRVNPVSAEGPAREYEIAAEGAQEKVRVSFRLPMLDHVGVWHPTCGRNRGLPQWFHPQKTDACFYRGAPVLATLRADGTAHCTKITLSALFDNKKSSSSRSCFFYCQIGRNELSL